MVSARKQAATPPALVERLFGAAGDDAVLVGGQALSWWVKHYRVAVPVHVGAISDDVEFLAHAPTARALIERLATAMQGVASFPRRRALTALMAQVMRPLDDDEVLNADVLNNVFGLTAIAVRKAAVRVVDGDASFLVMHPLHVLRSRLINLHKLPEKQDEKGRMQLALAIDMVREHGRSVAAQSAPARLASGRSPIQPLVGEIERMARSDAGRNIAKRWGLHVADAIDPAPIPAGPFWQRRWPALRVLMSPACAGHVAVPAEVRR